MLPYTQLIDINDVRGAHFTLRSFVDVDNCPFVAQSIEEE